MTIYWVPQQDVMSRRWDHGWWNAARRAAVLAVGLCIVNGAQDVGAQTTYTVIPAVPSASETAIVQPVRTAAHVTLTVQDSTVKSVINALARQAHLQPFFKDSPLLAKRITVRIVDANVMDAFAVALKGTGLEARVAPDGKGVFVRPQTKPLSDARRSEGSIGGRVTDSTTGAGLGGATVHVVGSKLFATTSDSGHFTLKSVPSGDQVVSIHRIGYRSVERTVTVVDSERVTLNVKMVSTTNMLSGVVTTATGEQHKIEVGNDITSLNVDSIMQVAPITSVTDLLETRVPGLTVMHSSGAPGDPSRLRLRGAGSVNENNDPIVIVDGVRVYASQSDARNDNLAPTDRYNGGIRNGGGIIAKSGSSYAAPSPLDQIDPNSIATIEVFKGPSASALYGSDAANGVIVITTKHGRAGPTQWNLAVSNGVNWIPGNWPTNYFRFGSNQVNYGGLLCQWDERNCSVDSIVTFQALNDPRYTVLAHGSNQTAAFTVSGGVPAVQYSLTGSAGSDLGNLKLPEIEQQRYERLYGPVPAWMVRPDHYRTWAVSGELTVQPTTAVRTTFHSSLYNSAQQHSSLEQSIPQLEGTLIADGNFIIPNNLPQSLTTSPLLTGDVEKATAGSLASTNAVTLAWQISPWLPLTIEGGLNTIQRTDQTSVPYGVNGCGIGLSCFDSTGSYGLGRGSSDVRTLNVRTEVPVFHRFLSVGMGTSVENATTADFTAYTRQLAPGVSVPTTFPTATDGESSFGQSTTSASTYGWFVEPRFNVGSRFFVAPGFRLDGGSGGTGSAGGSSGLSGFPKIDLSYVAVDRQSAPPLFGVLTQLRPRLAFGFAGTQPLPQNRLRLFNALASDYVLKDPGQGSLTESALCTPTLVLDGSTPMPAVCLNSLGNTQLRPERSRELEAGVDATLWQGRLSLEYTRSTKTRDDAILSIPIAPSISGDGGVGFSVEKNVGVIRNTGTEMTVNAVLLQRRALSWNIGVNLSNTNSLVVRLNPGQPPLCFGDGTPCQGTRVVADYPLFGVWAQPIVSFVDKNQDGIIEPSELRLGDSAVYVGQPEPKYEANFTTDVTLFNGRLSAHATFAYQNGLTQENQGACSSGSFALIPNAPNTPLATQAAVVAAGCNITAGGLTGIGLIQTVNTLRFQNVSFNYNVPSHIATWFRVPRIVVALQGENLGLHTNYRGKDPGVNAFSTVSAGDETADLGEIPQPRTWRVNVSLGN